MSDRPIDHNLTNSTDVRVTPPSEEERAKFKHKLAQVLDRSLTVDRMEVKLPSDLTGYWCPRDSVSVAQAEMRGYQIDTHYGKINSLNDTADGTSVVGDVVYMIRPKWMKEEEDKLINKRYVETHITDRRKLKEEKDFLAQNELPPIVNSTAIDATGSQIEEVLTPNK